MSQTIGFVLACYLGPVFGKLADSYGRRRVFALGAFINMLIPLAIAGYLWLGTSFILVYVALTVTPPTPFQIVLMACVIDVSPPEQRAKNIGLVMGAINLGLLGGILITTQYTDNRVLSLASAGITTFNFCLIVCILPESLPARLSLISSLSHVIELSYS